MKLLIHFNIPCQNQMLRFRKFISPGLFVFMAGCNYNPLGGSLEYENAWFYLEGFFIFQERLPQNPGGYSSIEDLYKSVEERHTRYVPPAETRQVIDNLENRQGGFGIKIHDLDSGFLVTLVFSDSPAKNGGMLAGDIIVEVDQEDVTGLSFGEFTDKLKADLGTKKNLKVLRDSAETFLTITVGEFIAPSVFVNTRKSDSLLNLSSALNENTALITLSRFVKPGAGMGSALEFDTALILTADYQYTILDLRHNLGGEVNVTLDIASHFMEEGSEIVKVNERRVTQDRNGFESRETVWLSEGGGDALERSFFILMDSLSASASEILISAIKTNRPDILTIGHRSYGKARGQSVIDPPALEGIAFITSTLLSLPNGEQFDSVGIEPDISAGPGGNAFDLVLDMINELDSAGGSRRGWPYPGGQFENVTYSREPFMYKWD